MMRLRTTLCAMVGALVLSLAAPALVSAQDTDTAAEKREAKKKKRAEKRKKQRESKKRESKKQARADKADAPASETATTEHGEKGPSQAPSARDAAQAAAREAAQGVDAEIVKEGDTSVKVMQFTGLDIEGRLKSPQLLYFVNRVRAEFDRPRLPHRSFMPEVERAAEAEPLR